MENFWKNFGIILKVLKMELNKYHNFIYYQMQ